MKKLIGLKKIKTAVFISGTGSNLKNLIKFSKTKISPILIKLIISNSKKAKGLKYSTQYNVEKKIVNFNNNFAENKILNYINKKNNIEDKEMLKTFNCGVGFCLIVDPKNLDKIKKFFTKEYKPYVIGKIILGKNKIKLNEKINWS